MDFSKQCSDCEVAASPLYPLWLSLLTPFVQNPRADAASMLKHCITQSWVCIDLPSLPRVACLCLCLRMCFTVPEPVALCPPPSSSCTQRLCRERESERGEESRGLRSRRDRVPYSLRTDSKGPSQSRGPKAVAPNLKNNESKSSRFKH